ncbi:MAG TPA: hypothetical protein VFB97_03390 [Bacteroidales bacterium]|nr:hypothetical protein [Bacteroidales bacterium]
MKKGMLLIFGVAAMLIFACAPIENRETAGKLLSGTDLQVDVHQTTTGGNQIAMINSTPGVSGMFDYLIAQSTRKNDTILLPFLGTSTITFYGTSAGGVVKYTKDIIVTTIDHPTDTMWTNLAGTGTKTWVWATDIPGGNCYGNGAFEGNYAPGWWTCKAADLAGWGCLNDQMTFDLIGKANYTLVTGNIGVDGKPAGTYKGIFSFDMKTRLKLPDGTDYSVGVLTPGDVVSRGFQPNGGTAGNRPNIYTYNFLRINADQMYLVVPEPGAGQWGTAWFWMFKRSGYAYPTK